MVVFKHAFLGKVAGGVWGALLISLCLVGLEVEHHGFHHGHDSGKGVAAGVCVGLGVGLGVGVALGVCVAVGAGESLGPARDAGAGLAAEAAPSLDVA